MLYVCTQSILWLSSEGLRLDSRRVAKYKGKHILQITFWSIRRTKKERKFYQLFPFLAPKWTEPTFFASGWMFKKNFWANQLNYFNLYQQFNDMQLEWIKYLCWITLFVERSFTHWDMKFPLKLPPLVSNTYN